MTFIEFLIFYCVFALLFAFGRLYVRRYFLTFKDAKDGLATILAIIYVIVFSPVAMPFFIGACLTRNT